MPLSTEAVPNRPLSGAELIEYVLSVMRKRLESDCHFTRTIAYRQIAFDVTVHFHLGTPVGEHVVAVSGLNEEGTWKAGAPPLSPEPEEAEVVASEQHAEVNDPNLVRVHTGQPIVTVTKTPPKPGDILPKIERHETRYDPTNYPEPQAPVETDTSDKTAENWRVARKKRSRE
jgi:hypothetical protein